MDSPASCPEIELPESYISWLIKTGYFVHPRCTNILCRFHSRPPDSYNALPNYNHDFLILQMSDATDEATFLAAAQPLDEIIGYIGAVPSIALPKSRS